MQQLRSFTLIWGVLLHIQVSLCAQSGADAAVLDFELERFAAMEAQDTAGLRNYLDDQLVYLHSNGIQESKQQHLDAIGSGAIVYRNMKRQANPVIRRYGKIALVNGRVAVTGQLRGNDFTILLLYTAVYRKKKGRWQLLNWQSTRVDSE